MEDGWLHEVAFCHPVALRTIQEGGDHMTPVQCLFGLGAVLRWLPNIVCIVKAFLALPRQLLCLPVLRHIRT